MNTNDETDKIIDLLHQKAKNLISENKTEIEIIHALTKEGIDAAYAQSIIENIFKEKIMQKRFRNSIIMGSAYIIGGCIINYYSYKTSESSNSMFFHLFWGIIVVGIIIIIRAFYMYRK